MIFTIYRNFSEFRFIFNFYLIKTIKINAKVANYCVGPRGRDVAHKATWLFHVDTYERLRGAEVTRRRIFIFIIYSIL